MTTAELKELAMCVYLTHDQTCPAFTLAKVVLALVAAQEARDVVKEKVSLN